MECSPKVLALICLSTSAKPEACPTRPLDKLILEAGAARLLDDDYGTVSLVVGQTTVGLYAKVSRPPPPYLDRRDSHKRFRQRLLPRCDASR